MNSANILPPELKKHTLGAPDKQHRNYPSRMSDSEVMTILMLFHTCRFRDLKSFYLGCVCRHMHRTMKGRAAKGKCTMEWFYGFKLHLVINDKGEIIQRHAKQRGRPDTTEGQALHGKVFSI